MASKEKYSKNYRRAAEQLWDLLDDIDSTLQLIKPSTPDDLAKLTALIQKKLRKRHEFFHYDGFELYDYEEWKDKQKQTKDNLENFLNDYESQQNLTKPSRLKKID